MDNNTKPILVVSKCLGFDKCRYDGSMIENEFIEKLKKYVEIIPFCPEVQCGLSIPRDTLRIVELDEKKELIQLKTERNLTNEIINSSEKFLSDLKEIDGFILKCKSPSCGVKDAKNYSSIEKGSAVKKGKGFFSEKVIEHFPYLPLEDEGRLNNFKIREHFLSRIFILADFRKAKLTLNFDELRKFHIKNTMLFIAYNHKYSKILDSLIFNEPDNLETVFKEYEFNLHRLLQRAPRYTSNINVILKAVEQFKDKITDEEMQFIWNTIDKYRNGYIPFSVLLYLVKGYIIRFELDNLLNQTFFMPYPEELILLNDSENIIN